MCSSIENINDTCHQQVVINQEWLNSVPQEYLDITPVHWLQYPPPSCLTHSLIGALYSVLLIIGLFGSMFIIGTFTLVRSIRDPHTTFLFNLALADLLMILEIPPFIYNCVTCGPSFGVIGCKLHGFIGALSGTASLTTITVISIERFIVIRYPFETKSVLSKKRSLFVCLFIWSYSFGIAAPPLFGLVNGYVPEGFLTTCSFDYLSKDPSSQLFVLSMFFTSYIIPLTLITLSYIGIIMSMKNSRKQFTGSESIDGKRTLGEEKVFELSQRKEFDLMRSCLSLISLWTMAWTPYAIVSLIGLFTNGSLITPEVSMYPALFAKTASLIDSYVYGLSHPGFRKELKATLLYIGFLREDRIKKHLDNMGITSARLRTLSKTESNGFYGLPSVAV